MPKHGIGFVWQDHTFLIVADGPHRLVIYADGARVLTLNVG